MKWRQFFRAVGLKLKGGEWEGKKEEERKRDEKRKREKERQKIFPHTPYMHDDNIMIDHPLSQIARIPSIKKSSNNQSEQKDKQVIEVVSYFVR